jgi:hypothetical protein
LAVLAFAAEGAPFRLLEMGLDVLTNQYIGEVPAEVAGEVEDTARWLLCGGAQGLEQLACRSLMQVLGGYVHCPCAVCVHSLSALLGYLL